MFFWEIVNGNILFLKCRKKAFRSDWFLSVTTQDVKIVLEVWKVPPPPPLQLWALFTPVITSQRQIMQTDQCGAVEFI